MMKISLLVMVLALAVAGCGASPRGARSVPPTMVPTLTPTPTDALRHDATTLAQDLRISVDDALLRLQQQELVGQLNAQLEQREAATFAGLWVQQQPTYHIVVAFTRDGQSTIRPYMAGTALEPFIEVRTATASYADLRAAQQAAQQQLHTLGLVADSGINLPSNQVEICVTDRALFERTLRQAGIQLPAHIVLITIYEPLGDHPPFPVTPEPAVAFPQLRMRSGAFMAALLSGTLVLRDGCLGVSTGADFVGELIIWQPDYYLNRRDGALEILDRTGTVVARVGAPIRIGGGEVPRSVDLERQLRAPLPASCTGPYWLMGELASSP